MSVERPESISRPVTLLARATSFGLGALAVGLAVTATPGVPFLASSMSSAVLCGATALTGWLMTNKAVEARNYNEARLDAIKTAEETGQAPHLPKNPFLDPSKQPHPFTSRTARMLAGAMIVVGIATSIALLANPAALIEIAPNLTFLPQAVQEVGRFAIASAFTLGGASLLKMASVGESTRRFAEYEAAHHVNHRDDLELTHSQEVGVEKAPSTSYEYDTPSHPANQPERKSFVASLFEERGLEQNTSQER